MIRFENEVVIDRPRDEVFGYVSDLRNIPEWNYAVDRTEPIGSVEPAEGAVYRQRRSIPVPREEELRIERFDEPDRLIVEGTLGPFDAALDYQFVRVKGGTRVRNQVSLEADGVLRLAQPFARSRVQREVRANLEVLKEILEAPAS